LKLEVPYFKQEKSTTCGPACVRMVIEYNGIQLSETELEDVCETSWLGNTCEELASGVNLTWEWDWPKMFNYFSPLGKNIHSKE